MKTNLLKLLASLSLIAPLAANAAPIVYDVNRIIGTGTVMGTITTDGTIGALDTSNIMDWSLTLATGGTTDTISQALGDNVAASPGQLAMVASATSLSYDFGTGDLWRFFDAGASLWKLSNVTETVSTSGGGAQEASVRGRQTIATVAVQGLFEPGTLGLALIGLAGLGFSRKRRQRQSAAL